MGKNGLGWSSPLVVTAAGAALAAALWRSAVLPVQSPRETDSVAGATTETTATTALPADVPTSHWAYPANGSPTGVFTSAPDTAVEVRFTLHPNGDGSGEGEIVSSKDYGDSIDALIEARCCALQNRTDAPGLCARDSGARLVNDVGVRLKSFADVENGRRVYCVLQGLHFVWPLVSVGHVFYPKNVVGPIPQKPVRLTQMSDRPRVFSVENFVAPEEITELLEANENRMTPSEVGFYGWQDDTRTSSTSWDYATPAALAIQRRTFELLGMDYDPMLADAMQVLRYTSDGYQGMGEWYKPHVDWFSADGYDGSVPQVDNGTNRFATMFLYLSDVEEGGHTVFPLSTSHQGYRGEKIVHDGTVDTPGYINTAEARAACNASATSALRIAPKAGNAALFYSQTPVAGLDPWSLHGGCPPIRGIKWSANVWIWNRLRPDKAKAKDKPKGLPDKQNEASMKVAFKNELGEAVVLWWDGNTPVDLAKEKFDVALAKDAAAKENKRFVHQYDIAPKVTRDMSTYDGHVFVAVSSTTGKVVWTHKMSKQLDAPAPGAPGSVPGDPWVIVMKGAI